MSNRSVFKVCLKVLRISISADWQDYTASQTKCRIPILLRQDVVALGLWHAIEARRCSHCVCSHVSENYPFPNIHFWQQAFIQDTVQTVTCWTPDAACVLMFIGHHLRLITTHQYISYSWYSIECNSTQTRCLHLKTRVMETTTCYYIRHTYYAYYTSN